MQQFNLSLWLKDKSRKVITRNGMETEIIHDSFPLVAIINGIAYNFDHDGKFQSNKTNHKYDLFFADEEEELTEFEKAVKQVMWTAYNYDDCSNGKDVDDISNVKATSKTLLDLARKELTKNLPQKNDPIFELLEIFGEWLGKNGYSFKFPKSDTLKNLPKWKKAKKDEELDCHVAIQQDDRVVLSDFVQKDEYYITLDVLKKLPKEE